MILAAWIIGLFGFVAMIWIFVRWFAYRVRRFERQMEDVSNLSDFI